MKITDPSKLCKLNCERSKITKRLAEENEVHLIEMYQHILNNYNIILNTNHFNENSCNNSKGI